MKRNVARVALLALAFVVPTVVSAQTYPTKPIRMVAPFPAGGTSDTIARILGQKLTEAWKQQAIVENRAGVGGSLGSAVVAKSPPDGYTLLVGNVGPVAINHHVYKNVGYDPIRDFTPIAGIGGFFMSRLLRSVRRKMLTVAVPAVLEQTYRRPATGS